MTEIRYFPPICRGKVDDEVTEAAKGAIRWRKLTQCRLRHGRNRGETSGCTLIYSWDRKNRLHSVWHKICVSV